MNLIEHYQGAKKVVLSNQLVETLQELVQRLAPLAGAISSGGSQIRVTQIAVPSTAVTGPLTNAQYIATPIAGGVHYTQRTAIENQTAVQSNIQNVSIS